jgi:methylglutaconyl-CoA hydratase
MDYQNILFTREDTGVTRITLNRPHCHNAFDDQTITEIRHALSAVAERPDTRALVLESEGKHFSAGADLDWMRRMADYDFGHNMRDAEALAAMLADLYSLPVPTVARVQGAAFGGAVGLVACCDLAIASDRALFSLSEVRIGLVPATISPYVIRAIGARAALRYSMTGERFDASTAQRLGLVSEVCPADELDSGLQSLLDALLAGGPEAVMAAKDLIRSVAGRGLDEELIEDTCARIAHIRVSAEGQEGLKAFLEKREPAWRSGEGS